MDTTGVITFEECTGNAARLLRDAEMETDLMKMERTEKLADSWIALAHLIKFAQDLC